MSKNYRQGQILKLIRSKPIYTQEELAQELKGFGINATQVTLSRDLRDLRLVKTPEGYQEIAAGETGQQLASLIADFLRDARIAQNLLVLKTDPGHASIIAVALDDENWPEVVGTLAGDDTVLVIATDNTTAADLRERLLRLM
ncbi:MAG: transcriptional regulator, ArgR family [Bryobacterales bacterium]|nr:transcriptional regulator, ArgR family [Bryobacterales bacterium]